jgi:hypothetical protein
LFDDPEGADDRLSPAKTADSDLEIEQRALRLCAPQPFRRNGDWAERVLLDACAAWRRFFG